MYLIIFFSRDSWTDHLSSFPRVLCSCWWLARLLSLPYPDILCQEACDSHLCHGLFIHKGLDAHGSGVPDGLSLRGDPSPVDNDVEVNLPQHFGELKRIHDDVPLVQVEKVANVALYVGVVGVNDSHFTAAWFGHTDSGYWSLFLPWKRKLSFDVVSIRLCQWNFLRLKLLLEFCKL